MSVPAPAPTTEINIKQSGEPPSGEEAKAKAREMKAQEMKAKEKALKEGKKVDGESPLKPTNVAVPQVKQPSAPKGEAKGAPKAKQKGAEAKPKGPPPKPQESKADAKPAPNKGGANEKGAKADVDAEIRDYLAKAPKDESKREVHANVKQLADAAANLAESAPAPKAKDGAVKGALKSMVPGMDSLMAKTDKEKADSDFGKMTGAGENPYAQFDGTLKTWGSKIFRVRNFLSGASSFLGKVGMVLTVIGVLISITGIGAPLGAPIATIGRVLGVITLVMDAINFILSAVLTGLLAMELAKEPPPDPAKVQKLAGQLLEESANTFQALLSVGLALPGVQKLAGMVAGGVKKMATGVAKMVGKFIGKVGLGAAKGLGKVLAATWSKTKTLFGSTLKKAGGPGVMDKIKGVFTKGTDLAKTGFGKAKDFVGRTGSKLIDKVNGPLEKAVAKFENTAVGKGLNKLDAKAIKFNEALDKYTGKTLLERGENAAGYYASKLGAKADGVAERWGSKAEESLGKQADKIEESAQKSAAENLKKQEKEAAEKAAKEAEEAEAKAAAGEAKAGTEAPKPKEEAPKPKEGEPKPEGDAEKAAGSTEPKKEPGGDWEKFQKDKEAALKRAETQKKRQLEDEKNDAKVDYNAEDRKLRNMKNRKKRGNRKYTDEQIAEQEAKTAAAKQKLEGSKDKLQVEEDRLAAKEAAEAPGKAASERAEKRLNDARGGKNAEGEAAEGLSDAEKAANSEFKDAQHWKDPEKETAGGIWKEKVGEQRELSKEKDEAANESKAEQEKKALELLREQIHHQTDEIHDDVAEQSAAPAVAELEGGGDGGGGLFDEVHGMLASVEGEDGEHKAGEEDKSADDEHKQPGQENKADEGGGDEHKGDKKDQGGDSKSPGPQQPAGAVPYWPELLDEYKQDLQTLQKTRESLKKYREAQIEGYKQAAGIKDSAAEQKEKAKKGQKDSEPVKKDAGANAKTLADSGKNAAKTGGEAGKGQAKEGEASSAGQEGASAAGTEVPDPPAPHWWDHILNLAKKFICNYIGKALKWVQDWFTDKIISLFTGGKLNLEKVNAMAKGVQQQTGEDSNKSKQSEGDAGKAGDKQKANEQKAEEEMTEAQKLHEECKKNVASADELLTTIDEVEQLVQKEIAQGEQWLNELKASKEKEKQELAAKEAQKQKEQEQKQKEQEKKAQDAANKKDGKDKDKDKATPEQVQKLGQAAKAVTAGSAQNHQKVVRGFESAKNALAQSKGDKQVNHEAVESAVQVFEQHAREAVSHHQSETDSVRGKMGAVAGKGQMKRSEVHGVVQEIEGAAKESDQSLTETLQSLKKAFETSYKAQRKRGSHKYEGPGQHLPNHGHGGSHAHAE